MRATTRGVTVEVCSDCLEHGWYICNQCYRVVHVDGNHRCYRSFGEKLLGLLARDMPNLKEKKGLLTKKTMNEEPFILKKGQRIAKLTDEELLLAADIVRDEFERAMDTYISLAAAKSYRLTWAFDKKRSAGVRYGKYKDELGKRGMWPRWKANYIKQHPDSSLNPAIYRKQSIDLVNRANTAFAEAEEK